MCQAQCLAAGPRDEKMLPLSSRGPTDQGGRQRSEQLVSICCSQRVTEDEGHAMAGVSLGRGVSCEKAQQASRTERNLGCVCVCVVGGQRRGADSTAKLLIGKLAQPPNDGCAFSAGHVQSPRLSGSSRVYTPNRHTCTRAPGNTCGDVHGGTVCNSSNLKSTHMLIHG